MNEPNPPKRRWLSFGLRSLLALILVLAIALAWISQRLNEGRRHQEIGKQLSTLDCGVGFSHYIWLTSSPPHQVSTISPWVESLGLANCYRRINSVNFYSPYDKQMDKALELIYQLEHLEQASFGRYPLTQAEIDPLLENVQIESLYLHGAKLTDKEIPGFRKQKSMNWLCVSNTRFSNPAIDDLPESLTYLDATRTRINDEGLPKLIRLNNLASLNLRRTPTTREAVEELRVQMPWCKIEWRQLNQ